MQFKTATVAILTALLAVAECAPTAGTSANPQGEVLVKRKDLCGASSFENRGSTASPTVNDCQALANKLSDNDSWVLTSFQPHREIASSGGCAFGIEWGQLYQGSVVVGSRDVKDLIRSSIEKFKRGDNKVGARGTMPCGPEGVLVSWGLY
ncbi:putative necrosis-inducing factor-domain-containing protein [Cladorrhinum samala]|uniref:Necrosis-inducing factor-domain-containing protein n=1 Tax=Cladorrhinum samala TaxID=585594 RepID=A0AAV9HUE0_9PEZI|nr:putative necrosis-inducing factor-domain-containing protein [Cladorrhinum samala]